MSAADVMDVEPMPDEPTSVVHIPTRVARRTVEDVTDAMTELKLIRTFIANEMTDGTDYGVIPGTGTKKNMLLPGAQKVNMFFNSRPDYQVERVELGDGHVEFIINTALISRATGQVIGAGVGSCSTMEGKYRYRKAERTCPACNAPAIIKGKAEYGGGWVCYDKKGGCKAKYKDGDPAIESQEAGQVENPNIYDIRNTVLKMAKKRSLVDASIGLGCLSELFTQDLEDIFDIPESNSGAGSPTVTRTHQNVQPPDKPSTTPKEASKSDPASEVGVQVKTIAPRAFGKLWAQGGFVIDDEDKKYTFPHKLLKVAEDAITSGARLKITYRREGNYLNVSKAEPV